MMNHLLYLSNALKNSEYSRSICILLNLVGEPMTRINFEFSIYERQTAISEFERSLESNMLESLHTIEHAARNPDTTQSGWHISASKKCEIAGTTWLKLINHQNLPESRNKSILLATKALYYMDMSTSRLYQALNSADYTIEIYKKFLKNSAITCFISISVDKFITFENIKDNIKTIRDIMIRKFDVKETEGAFRAVYDYLSEGNYSNEVQLLFLEYSYDMQNIKHDCYNNTNPNKHIIELYKKYLYLKLDVAVHSNDTVIEYAMNIEIDKMSQRELELSGNDVGFNVVGSNDETASSIEPPSTLRRRSSHP